MANNPWISIWCRPRETIRSIVEENPNRALWILASIYGFSSMLNLFQSFSVGESVGVLLILLFALILAPLWGIVIFSIWSWIVSWTGKWLKGVGDFRAIRAAYAWSCVPLVVNVALWLVLIALFGRHLFLASPEETFPQAQMTLLFLLLIAKVILAVWSLVIYINALAEVQQFSVLRSIGNLLLSWIILTVVVFAIFWAANKVMGMKVLQVFWEHSIYL